MSIVIGLVMGIVVGTGLDLVARAHAARCRRACVLDRLARLCVPDAPEPTPAQARILRFAA